MEPVITPTQARTEQPANPPPSLPSIPEVYFNTLETVLTLAGGYIVWYATKQLNILKVKLEKLKAETEKPNLLDVQAESQVTHWLYLIKDKLECNSIALTLLHNGQTTPYGYHFIKTTTVQRISDSGLRYSKEPNRFYPLTFSTAETINKFFVNPNFAPVTYTYILRINNLDIGYLDATYYKEKADINDLPISDYIKNLSEALIDNYV